MRLYGKGFRVEGVGFGVIGLLVKAPKDVSSR